MIIIILCTNMDRYSQSSWYSLITSSIIIIIIIKDSCSTTDSQQTPMVYVIGLFNSYSNSCVNFVPCRLYINYYAVYIFRDSKMFEKVKVFS